MAGLDETMKKFGGSPDTTGSGTSLALLKQLFPACMEVQMKKGYTDFYAQFTWKDTTKLEKQIGRVKFIRFKINFILQFHFASSISLITS
jgi:hypothetical protein